MNAKYFGAICGILITISWAFSASNLCALEADVYEVDNTPAQALVRPVLNAGAQNHTIHVTNDIDYVHCMVSSGHTYRFETYGLDASMDTYLYLIASDGTTVLAEDDDAGAGYASLIEYQFSTLGTNYLLIEDLNLHHGTHAGSTGTYSIAMTDLGGPGSAGTPKWQKEFAGTIYSSPAIGADGKIYLGLPDGRLCAFNPDGSTARVWNAGAAIYSAPAISADGTIYAGSLDSKLYGFNPDGTTGQVWQTGAAILGSPAIGPDGSIYIGSFDNKLYGFNADGTTGHVWTTQNVIWSSPVIASDGSIYAGSFDGNFYGFNPDGSTNHVWRMDSAIQISSPAIDLSGNIYIGTIGGNLYGFNPNGTTNHVWNTAVGILAAPVIDSDGKIYLGLSDGKLCAFNPDGTTGQVWNAGPFIGSAPVLGSDGSIYACGEQVYSFKSDGTTNWHSLFGSSFARGSPAIDTNGVLYVAAPAKFTAFYATGTLARTVWPKFQHDLKNTGAMPPISPANVAATDGLYNNKIRVGWTPVTYANSYDILRGTNSNVSGAQIYAQAVAVTNYDDTAAVSGTTYYYWVLSRNNSGVNLLPGASDTGWQHMFVSSAAGDYDRDSLADPAVYNCNNGTWKVRFSGGNYVMGVASNLLGGAGFTAATADYDGDGLADPAVYEEATGNWTVMLTSANYTSVTIPGFLGAQGYSGLGGDFDGDGLADPAIYDESSGYWIFRLSGLGYVETALTHTLGGQGWCAVLADLDGDRFADPAVYNETSGTWEALLSSANYSRVQCNGLLGGAGFKPVPADYDGDRLADPAVYNPTTGDWKVMLSGANYYLVTISGFLGLP